jgi:hypothetical protein
LSLIKIPRAKRSLNASYGTGFWITPGSPGNAFYCIGPSFPMRSPRPPPDLRRCSSSIGTKSFALVMGSKSNGPTRALAWASSDNRSSWFLFCSYRLGWIGLGACLQVRCWSLLANQVGFLFGLVRFQCVLWFVVSME